MKYRLEADTSPVFRLFMYAETLLPKSFNIRSIFREGVERKATSPRRENTSPVSITTNAYSCVFSEQKFYHGLPAEDSVHDG